MAPTVAMRHRRCISTTKLLDSSAVFIGWTPLEWHKDTFLSTTTIDEKEAWLEALLKSGDKSVDNEAFMVVLNALSTSDDARAPRKAEQWILRLRNHPQVQPTTAAYVAVIRTWANASKEQPIVVVNRAERWLNELVGMSEAHPGLECLRPTIELYNAYLDACTRGRPGKNKHNRFYVEKNAIQADALARRLHSKFHHEGESAQVIPTTDTLNYVLRGWTRCLYHEVALEKVQGILRLMESHQRNNPVHSTMRPNTKSYTLAMDAFVRMAKMKARRSIEAGRFSSDTTINGIEEMNEAEAILKYMQDLHNAGVEGVVPHRVSYNLLISGWAGLAGFSHLDAPFRAEEILRTMFTHQDNGFMETAPDRISFEKVMLAWSVSGHPNAGRRAQWWLKKLWNEAELQGNENLLPTVTTYNIVIRALAKSEGALPAENLLLDLGDKYREEKSISLCPNSESFALVIHAWIRQSHRKQDGIEERVNALDRAVQWLSSLREIEFKNDLSTAPELYHKTLEATKKCVKERPELLDVAKRIFDDMRCSRHGLDVFAYALFLEIALVALSSPDHNQERTEFIDGLFQSCRDDGLVAKYFVRAITNSIVKEEGWTTSERDDTMNRLFPTWPLPRSWTRNIRSPLFHVKASDISRNGPFKRQLVETTVESNNEYDDDHHPDDKSKN